MTTAARPGKSRAAVRTAARAPSDAVEPITSGPARSGSPGGTTSTGHGDWWSSDDEVDPR